MLNAAVAAAVQPAMADPHTELLRRAIRLLAEKKGDVWVNKAEIWPMIKRLDSTFDPKEAGFTNFAAMIKAKEDMVELRRGEFDQEVKLR